MNRHTLCQSLGSPGKYGEWIAATWASYAQHLGDINVFRKRARTEQDHAAYDAWMDLTNGERK